MKIGLERNKGTIYLALTIILVTISAFALLNNNDPLAFLSFFVLVSSIATLEFFFEWRYYRSHGALLASLQFIMLPFTIILAGAFWSYRINVKTIIRIKLSVLRIPIVILFVNMISLLLIIPIFITYRILYFYHVRRWNGFAIRRRLYRGRKIPYLIDSILSISLVVLAIEQGIMDMIVLLFSIRWIYQTVRYYILSPTYNQRSDPWLDTFLSNTDMRPRHLNDTFHQVRGRGNKRSSHTVSPVRQRSRTHIPVVSRNGPRTVSTNYKNTRQVSTNDQNRKATRSQTNKKNVVTIDTGLELSQHPKNGFSKDFVIPEGHVTKKDLSCMFCYDEIKVKDNPVILCPHCKFPAHEDEYFSWFRMSSMCARCSQSVSKTQQNKPKYRYSAKNYRQKVVDKL